MALAIGAAALARAHGVPTARLYVDPDRETSRLIGVRQIPEGDPRRRGRGRSHRGHDEAEAR